MTLKSEFLGTLRIELAETHFLGDTPAGWRRIDVFGGGTFVGPRVNGRVLSGGVDSLLRRSDGAMQPDVRLTVQTDDDAVIHIAYRGIRHGPADVMARIAQGGLDRLQVHRGILSRRFGPNRLRAPNSDLCLDMRTERASASGISLSSESRGG